MNSVKRRLFWITILILVVSGISFLCLCLVPLEQQKEDNAAVMLWEGGKHDDHVHYGQDDPFCRGCHPFLWRFNVRFKEGENIIDEAKKDAAKEELRQKNIEKNNGDKK